MIWTASISLGDMSADSSNRDIAAPAPGKSPAYPAIDRATWVDVYKRQVVDRAAYRTAPRSMVMNAQGISLRPAYLDAAAGNDVPNKSAMRWMRSKAVSYTHLDVYKRQH